MLAFTFVPEGSLPQECPTTYPALLQYNGVFIIEIDGEKYFSEPSFPIFEFLAQANEWRLSDNSSEVLEYVSLETDDNPLICFRRYENDQFSIYSPWQVFECKRTFSFHEVCQALDQLRYVVN